MGASFPIPVLAVAADAIRDLEGRDALSGLWTLFTKCKESLQDGRRLENISWRLWYREIMLTNLERERDLLDGEKFDLNPTTILEKEKAHDQHEEDSVKEETFPPLQPATELPSTIPPPYSPPLNAVPQSTPVEPLGSSPALPAGPLTSLSRTPSPRLSPTIPPHNRRPSTSRSRRSSFMNGTNGTPLSVGKIIFDMLPSSASPSTNSGESNKAGGLTMTPLFTPTRPPFSHKSTSSTVVSSAEEKETDDNPTLTLKDLPIIGRNGVSSLPTPEPQESESDPHQNTIVSGMVHISSSIPSLSIPVPTDLNTNSIPSKDSLQAVQKKVYTGPPSPSPSDREPCAWAHPEELGLLPSLSVSRDLTSDGPSIDAQTPPSSSSTTTMVQIQMQTSNSIPNINSPQQARPQPPTLVVVNPTPNPTPHPTPPATPLIHHGGLIKSQWLALPEGAVGVRQHHLLQAHLGPQALLPPAFVGVGCSGGIAVVNNHSSGNIGMNVIAATGPLGHEGFDRSRSSATAVRSESESHSVVSPENANASIIVATTAANLEHLSSNSQSQSDQHVSAFALAFDHSVHHQQQKGQKDSPKRLSISSTASSRGSRSDSSISGLNGASEGNTSTTNTSTSDYDQPERERDQYERLHSRTESVKPAAASSATGTTIGNEMFEVLPAGMAGMAMALQAQHGPKRLNSLSTIHSISTFTDGKHLITGSRNSDGEFDVFPVTNHIIAPANVASDEDAILERDEENDIAAPLSPLPASTEFTTATSPRTDKRRKRNSAPTLTTTVSPSLLSPTGYGSAQQGQYSQQPVSSPKSATSTTSGVHTRSGTTKIKQITAGRTTSRSRSVGGSSLGKSRSRSREAGIGAFGMTQVAPAMAPPAAPAPVATRKAPVVAAERGRAKVVMGRAGMKGKGVLRRNSSGMTAVRGDNAKNLDMELLEKQKEKEREHAEREEKEYQERMKIEAVGKGRQRSFNEEVEEHFNESEQEEMAILASIEEQRQRQKIVEEELMLAAIREREAEEAEAEMARRRAAAAAEAARQRQPQHKATGAFRLGSTSDGVGSKSAGSSSGLSPARRKFKGKGKRQTSQLTSVPNEEQEKILENKARQLSKPQLRQLQMMEQLLAQQTKQVTVERPQPAHERQLTPSGQEPPKQQSVKSSTSRKGKSRDVDVGENRKPKNSSSKIPANLEKHLASPLLPQNKRKIVLATTDESDFVTDSDDGSWSSEEMTGDEEDPVVREEQLRQEQLLHQQLLLQQQIQQEQEQQKLLQQQQQRAQRQRQRQQQQQQQHRQPARPAGVHRTQSNHYPPPNNTRTAKEIAEEQRKHQRHLNVQAIFDAAAEAQRQREMILKLPASSVQNLANSRAQSVGLLTQLMNPNPEIFPPNHPYRRGFSSADIKSNNASRGVPAIRPLTSLTPYENNGTNTSNAPPTIPEEHTKNQHGQQGTKSNSGTVAANPSAGVGGPSGAITGPPSRTASRTHFSPPTRPGGMTRAKSAAAIPLSSNFAIGSIGSNKVLPIIDHTSALPAPAVVTSSTGKIRLGPPPADAEMEDESDEEDNPPGGVSKSVAQERLRALARNARILKNRPSPPAPNVVAGASNQSGPTTQALTSGAATAQAVPVRVTASGNAQATAAQGVAAVHVNVDENVVPNWVVSQPQQQQQHVRTRSNAGQRNTVQFADIPDSANESSRHVPAAPIPVGYPYNLPISAMPSTPRTTRRQMLSTELPESLRRNLLWERQVSNGNLPAMRRSASGGGTRHNVLGGLQPLTAAPSAHPPMVELRPRRPAAAQVTDANARPVEPSHNNSQRPPDLSMEERRRQAMARNKSWANDYHGAGW